MRSILLATVMAAAGCSSPSAERKKAVDEGYLLGAADTVKQLYWAKQALEAPRRDRPEGRVEYYTWEETGRAADGRKLAPETVTVPVFVPAPAPSGERPP
ncbi:MAG TPA: hypothetical protein VFE25_09685 [Opitutaceae bacterium]|nr:hypothetical protein [Opitutaceae bacterium]